MFIEDILRQLPSLGVSGLLFVMWWFERKERLRGVLQVQEALKSAAQGVALSDRLLEVIRANTEALSELRAELRAHRGAEAEWFGRIARQLEELETG